MALNLTALKADILANGDAAITTALAMGDDGAIATWYNQEASPPYWLYKEFVNANDIRDSIDAQDIADITETDRGRAVDLLSIRADRGFSGANARDRSAWDDIFSVAAGDNSQQAILALWTRLSTYAEVVHALSTGTGADEANADTTSWQGALTHQNVRQALNS